MKTCCTPLSNIALEKPSDLGGIPVVCPAVVPSSVLCIQLPTNACMVLAWVVGIMMPICTKIK